MSQQENLKSMGLEQVDAFQQKLFWPVLYAMTRGCKIDIEGRKELSKNLKEALNNREGYFRSVLGHDLNPRSGLQMKALFYDDLGNTPIKNKAKKNSTSTVTCNNEALQILVEKDPLLTPLINAIEDYRTIGVFLSTFIDCKLDIDNRMRCSYNICGTDTFRLSSSKNAFGTGTNLQNIPNAVVHTSSYRYSLPSVKNIFIPDDGYMFFDLDLDRADLQVVVWEAGEQELKDALRKGVDMHLLNAFALMGKDVDLDSLIEGTEACSKLKSDYKKERQLAKAFIHGTNYGGKSKTMAKAAGITTHQADKFQKMYFGKYKGIKNWHTKVWDSLVKKGYVENSLGYRKYYFKISEDILPKALAWGPQSTVGCVINRVWVNLFESLKEVEVLLQVHDSLAGQFLSSNKEMVLKRIGELSKIILPYEDPLVIPVGIKLSEVSWGDCK